VLKLAILNVANCNFFWISFAASTDRSVLRSKVMGVRHNMPLMVGWVSVISEVAVYIVR